MLIHWLPLGLSLRVAGVATALSVVLGLWLAVILAKRQSPGTRLLAATFSTALALPAPVICYYLIAVFGSLWPLTEAGLTLAGIVSASPLVVRGSRAAFAGLDPAYAKAARSLGASDWRLFARVQLPLALSPIAAAAALAFARVLAELAAAHWLAIRLATSNS